MEHVGFLFILLLPAAKVHSSSLASVTQWEKKMQPLLGGRKRSAERQDFTFFMRGFFLQSHHSAILNSSEKMREKKKKKKEGRNHFYCTTTCKWTHKIILCESEVVVQLLRSYIRKSILLICSMYIFGWPCSLYSGLRHQPLFCGWFPI